MLLRTEWTGMPVMGMVEFLWGLSDGINGAGLSVALTYGGSRAVGEGFGITTILRYVLETCANLDEALTVLDRVPSHMAYNLVLADRHGQTAAVELRPGGGLRRREQSIATNHQQSGPAPDRPAFIRTLARQAHLETLFASQITRRTRWPRLSSLSRCSSAIMRKALVRSLLLSTIPPSVP